MSYTHVPARLRRLVIARADHLCEYCLIPEEHAFLGCQVDHIVSEKHGGETNADNLAYACCLCNRGKGSDVGSISPTTRQLVRLFNPRIDRWSDHFSLAGARIEPLTEIGEVTSRILEFNAFERLIERELLELAGYYPSPAALRRIHG